MRGMRKQKKYSYDSCVKTHDIRYRVSREMRYISVVVGGSVAQRCTIVQRWATRSISRIKVEQKKTMRRCWMGSSWTYSPARALLTCHFLPFRSSLPWQSILSTQAPCGYSQRGGFGL